MVALPFGLTSTSADLALAFALLALIGLLFSAFSYGVALHLRSEDALAPLLNSIMHPDAAALRHPAAADAGAGLAADDRQVEPVLLGGRRRPRPVRRRPRRPARVAGPGDRRPSWRSRPATWAARQFARSVR